MAEVAKVRAKIQVNSAINTRNGPITESLHELPPNSKVLVYREEGGWKGLYILMGITGETCKVQLPSGPTDFRTTVVKPYFEKLEQETSIGRIEEVREEADEEDNDMEGDEGTERRPQRNRRIPTRYLNITDADIAIYMA